MSRPRELSDNPSRDVSPWPIFSCFRADLSCLGSQRFADSYLEDIISEALRRPFGRGLPAGPQADSNLLGELSVIVEICPQWEHDLRDAGAGVCWSVDVPQWVDQ
jgi:hypothetical protein